MLNRKKKKEETPTTATEVSLSRDSAARAKRISEELESVFGPVDFLFSGLGKNIRMMEEAQRMNSFMDEGLTSGRDIIVKFVSAVAERVVFKDLDEITKFLDFLLADFSVTSFKAGVEYQKDKTKRELEAKNGEEKSNR